jgi:hypothetical protein
MLMSFVDVQTQSPCIENREMALLIEEGPFCVRFVFSPGEVKLGRLGWGEGNPGE